jgi:hypothetical protein
MVKGPNQEQNQNVVARHQQVTEASLNQPMIAQGLSVSSIATVFHACNKYDRNTRHGSTEVTGIIHAKQIQKQVSKCEKRTSVCSLALADYGRNTVKTGQTSQVA